MHADHQLAKLRRLSELAPNDPEVHFALARELARLLRHSEAANELRVVILLAPNHLEGRKLLSQLRDTGSIKPA